MWYNITMIKFSGAHAEYGEFVAKMMQKNNHEFYRHLNPETLQHQQKIYQKFYPEIITELNVIANYFGLPPEFVLYEGIASSVDHWRERLRPRNHGCTIFAIHEGDNTFVGRNYDWIPAVREFYGAYQIDIRGANRYFGFSDESVWYRHTGKRLRKPYFVDAVNEKGLYIGLTFSNIDAWNYGVLPMHFIRYVAEKCNTTRQALNAFAKIPGAIPKNFLIADAKGDIAVVEHAARHHAVLRPGANGVLIQTNHCLAPELIKYDRVRERNPRTNTFLRYAEAEYLINQQLPNFQFTDLRPILRQSHYIYNDDTIWSLALELSSQRFNIYHDTAMGQKQQKFEFNVKNGH